MGGKGATLFIKNRVTDVTYVMIEELIVRKEKWDKLEKQLRFWSVLGLAFLLLGIIHVIVLTTSTHTTYLLQFISGNQTFLFVLLGVALSFFQMQFVHKKAEKAETEYEELRKELVERSVELWDTEPLWQKRNETFQHLKDTFDINLYYK
ncbi:YpbF family protein [Halalkalibacterium halodurans]|uniref:YpbF family protein n=1 Tax=Halalkalibacterium halodurans TaxID=86665 RepID=UPI0010686D03|nr:YpbF family protein [Halalkalibacterium halodurans]MED3646752.1 YpbF family protein [Halalkalibacterium halodurans]TES56364.1 DUF2663 family protein [Halalkalibacterium halodurans]